MGKYSKKRIDWVEDSTVTTPAWADLGPLVPETSHTQETAQEEASDGTEKYAGTQEVYEVQSFSESQFTALKAKQDADEQVDLRIRSLDSAEADETEVGFSVKCRKEKLFQPRARQKYHFRFVRTFI